MAEPVDGRPGPGALALLEEAVQVLRQATFATLVCHAAGSVPFGLGLLVFWNSLTSQRLSDRSCALDALVLAILLVWMNYWRAVFAGRLRRQLSGAPGVHWTGGRVMRLVASQSFLSASKLVVLPLAALVGFPFASAVAFYRTATALADSGDLDPPQLMSRARELARVHPGQSWAILPLLAFLQLVLAINLALAFAILPLLIRMLTGWESEFNRSTAFLVRSPLFAVFVLIATWIVLDPFAQAVYSVRAFHGESVATGEDLRVALRRIRAGAVLAALLIFGVMPVRAADAVSAAELQQSVQKAMQAPEYGWRVPPPAAAGIGSRPWVLRVADKILDALDSAWSAVAKGIGTVLKWLFGKLGNTPVSGEGAAPGGALHWSLYVLMAAVAGAALWIVWRRRMFRRSARPGAAGGTGVAIRIDEENVTADLLPEERWIELALECLREQKLRLALRAYYLANLAWLGQRGFIAIHAGKTNREYELELRRRARQFAEGRGLFSANISAFEAAWYGLHEVPEVAVAEFRERIEGMKKVMA